MTSTDAALIRARITHLWDGGGDDLAKRIDLVRENLSRSRATYYLRCDRCRVFGRLQPGRAIAALGDRPYEGPLVVHPDGVAALYFRVGRDLTLGLVCLGCLHSA